VAQCIAAKRQMLETGESPGWVAHQLGHTNAERVYRRHHKFFRTCAGATGPRGPML